MKKLIAAITLVIICLTGCAKEEIWHPESTEVVFDMQELTVEKAYENTDLGSGEMEWYRVTATADSNTEPFYNITMSGLVGVKYYPGQYNNIRSEQYSGYVIEEIRDTEFYGSGENMQFIPFSDQIYTETGITEGTGTGDMAVLWGHGSYEAEHDKKVKNISDFLPGIFFDYDTTIKEYFRTEAVSVFVRLYVEEIVRCRPQDYHLTVRTEKPHHFDLT